MLLSLLHSQPELLVPSEMLIMPFIKLKRNKMEQKYKLYQSDTQILDQQV